MRSVTRLILAFESRQFRQVRFDVDQAADIGRAGGVAHALQFFDQRLVFAFEPGAGDVAAGPATDLGQTVTHPRQFVGEFLLCLGGSMRIGDLDLRRASC